MSNGPVVKSSPPSAGGLQIAGVALVLQAAVRAFFLASFLFVLARNPRFSQVIFGNIYPLATTVVLPVAFSVAGLVAGIMLLARVRAAAAVAGAFSLLGLLFVAFGAISVGYAFLCTTHHVPTQTYALMAFNAVVYLGTLIAVARSG